MTLRVPLKALKRPRPHLARRLLPNLLLTLALVAVSLGFGMAGYGYFEGMGRVDAFVNAAMILSGMGPIGALQSDGGKIFAGCYAVYSGLLLVISTGLILGPVLHDVLHRFHLEAEEDGRPH